MVLGSQEIRDCPMEELIRSEWGEFALEGIEEQTPQAIVSRRLENTLKLTS